MKPDALSVLVKEVRVIDPAVRISATGGINETTKEDVFMKTKNIVGNLLLILAVFTLLAVPAYAGDVNLSAAASLREAVTALSGSFSKSNPGVKFQNNFGASGAVAKQIENGAPADLFFSANPQWMEYLKEKKLMDEKSIIILAFNSLVFVGKPGLKVKTMQDVVTLEKIAIGSPKSVPAGQYAYEALKKAGIAGQLENKLVMARDVRECLMYAERGEVAGAFVYKTDAEQMAKNVKILFTVPQELYPRVTYPVGLTVPGSKKADAAAFHKFLQSPEAKGILEKFGFVAK
jgi:molybdate transport system substrate-binding protein